jgi:hypothetical protein
MILLAKIKKTLCRAEDQYKIRTQGYEQYLKDKSTEKRNLK